MPADGNAAMTTDSKLGLVIGLGLVMIVAVTYYPKTAETGKTPANVVPSLPNALPEKPPAPR